VPVVSVLRGRRRLGYSLGLDRRVMRANDVRPSLRHRLLALPLIYLVLPTVRNAAQLRGWWDGRRLR
jgi:hypothetical protein